MRGLTPSWDGQFPSEKALGPARFESLLERAGLVHLEASPAIKAFAVQPHRLTYWTPAGDGTSNKRTYTPDIVALDRDDQVIVIEVKAAAFARQDAWRAREPYIRQAYQVDHGVRFLLFTEVELRAQPRLSNCELILRHRMPGEDPAAGSMVRTTLAGLGRDATVDKVCSSATRGEITRQRAYSALMRLALRGVVAFDMSTPLTGASPVLFPDAAP